MPPERRRTPHRSAAAATICARRSGPPTMRCRSVASAPGTSRATSASRRPPLPPSPPPPAASAASRTALGTALARPGPGGAAGQAATSPAGGEPQGARVSRPSCRTASTPSSGPLAATARMLRPHHPRSSSCRTGRASSRTSRARSGSGPRWSTSPRSCNARRPAARTSRRSAWVRPGDGNRSTTGVGPSPRHSHRTSNSRSVSTWRRASRGAGITAGSVIGPTLGALPLPPGRFRPERVHLRTR